LDEGVEMSKIPLSKSGLEPRTFAWMLLHERLRHLDDIAAIDRDLKELYFDYDLSDLPPLDTFIEVDGVSYSKESL
jgi:hypothetical protein